MSDSSTSIERALSLLQERLREEGESLALAVEQLCVQHPELREQFRVLHDCYEAVQAAAGSRSFQAQIREILGEEETVAIALDEAVASGRFKRGDLILLVVFGAGFTWGAAVIEW